MHGVGQCSAIVSLLFFGASALAGPDWVEGTDGGGDAGSLPTGAQTIEGQGPISTLEGSLSASEGTSSDLEDLYLLRIGDFATFDITTSPGPDIAPPFDTALYLFTGPDHPLGEGLGLLANDDFDGLAGGASRLIGQITEGFLPDPPLLDGLLYYIGVSGAGRVPVDAQGQSLFSFDVPGTITGADGPGGQNPIAGWSGVGPTGIYGLPDMMGTFFVPAPGAFSAALVAGAFALRRRQR